ncbi:MAG: hypothetical protein R2789_15830 [Microthrixaceae bacterium]
MVVVVVVVLAGAVVVVVVVAGGGQAVASSWTVTVGTPKVNPAPIVLPLGMSRAP